MRKGVVIHYQKALQTPLCYQGRTERVTFKLPEVTCSNCLDLKRREQVKRDRNWDRNWEEIAETVKPKVAEVDRAVKEFCLSAGFGGRVFYGDYPPRVVVWLWIPERRRTRRRTVGLSVPSSIECGEVNTIRVYPPNDDELDRVSGFIARIAADLDLIPKRAFGSQFVPLNYELKERPTVAINEIRGEARL